MNSEKIKSRFEKKILKTESCWLWIGGKNGGGYGCYQGTTSHRISYWIYRGLIPEGMQALHNCPSGDNPSCVNPAHLWLGTQQENMDDKISKGRHENQKKTQCVRGHSFTDENT